MWQTNLKIFLVVVATLGLYTWVASAIPQVQSEVPEELTFTGDVSGEELAGAGEELYGGAGGCTACHGLGTRAPNLLTGHEGEGPIGGRCGDRVQGEDCKTYLYNSMVNPEAYLVEGFGPIMPDQSRTLSNTQIWALVAYLESQGGEVTVTAEDIQATAGEETSTPGGTATASAQAGTPPAGGAGGGSTEPMEIMRANACFGCHTLGEEGMEVGPTFNGIGARRDVDYLRRSILDPNAEAAEGYEQLLGAMPPNFGETMTAGQLEAVVRFLAEQR